MHICIPPLIDDNIAKDNIERVRTTRLNKSYWEKTNYLISFSLKKLHCSQNCVAIDSPKLFAPLLYSEWLSPGVRKDEREGVGGWEPVSNTLC